MSLTHGVLPTDPKAHLLLDPDLLDLVDQLQELLKPLLLLLVRVHLEAVKEANLPTVEALPVVVGDAVDGHHAHQRDDQACQSDSASPHFWGKIAKGGPLSRSPWCPEAQFFSSATI